MRWIYKKFNQYAIRFLNKGPFQFFNVLLANQWFQLLCQNVGNPLLLPFFSFALGIK